MRHRAIPTWYSALVIVRSGTRFLMVRERWFHQQWHVPAGGVDPGESILDAAQRETLEEAGIPIAVEGVLRVHHVPGTDGQARVRVILVARPADDTPPKSQPDRESLGASWLTIEEIERLKLREPQVLVLLRHLAAGGTIHPLEVLGGPEDPLPIW